MTTPPRDPQFAAVRIAELEATIQRVNLLLDGDAVIEAADENGTRFEAVNADDLRAALDGAS